MAAGVAPSRSAPSFGLVTYAVLSGGPVPSGLMLEGAAHLAGALHRAGFGPRIYDFNNLDTIDFIARHGKAAFVDQCVDTLHAEIQRLRMKIVGFTLYTNGFYDCARIALQLKARNPGLLVVAGGPLVGWLEERIFGLTDAFDILVRGEGDVAIVKLAALAYRNGAIADVPGAIYRSGGQITRNPRHATDIATLPLPIYDEAIYPSFSKKIPVATLRTSVGCTWGRCRYCVQPRLHGRYRERRMDDILLETEALREAYGLTSFRLSDPSPRPARIAELAAGIASDQRFACFLYPDPDVDLGRAAKGLSAIFLGLERSRPDDLIALNKCRDPLAHVESAARLVAQARGLGVATIVANIVPIADDTTASIRAHLDEVLALNPDFVTATPLIPMPGSPLYRQAAKRGRATGVVLEDDYIEKISRWTFDPLGPSAAWPEAPFRIRVDGRYVAPLSVTSEQFAAPLGAAGIAVASDEIVLMAHHHHNGLSADQAERRKEVLAFQKHIRATMGASRPVRDRRTPPEGEWI